MDFSRKKLAAILLAAGMVARVSPVVAQETENLPDATSPSTLIDLNRGVTFEISPHTGMMGGSGIFGLRLSMNYSSINFELAGEQVIGNTANLYPISVNVLLNLATRSRLIPYGAVGAGLLLAVPTNTIGDETVSSLGINFGGGARYYLTSTFGFRVEVKQYITNVASKRDLKSELLIFQEVSVGATFMLH